MSRDIDYRPTDIQTGAPVFDPHLDPEQLLSEVFGASVCTRGGHPRDQMWLTRTMVNCPVCRMGFGRHTFVGLSAEVEAIHPKVHCSNWKPGDALDRYHGRWCLNSKPTLVRP